MKMNFEYYQIQKWILQTVKSEKVHEKMELLVWPQKSKSVKAIYMYVSESSRYALLENGIVYYAMTYCFGDFSVWSARILLNFCWVSIFFNILIVNISWTVAQTLINHNSFWKSVMRTLL